MSSPYIKGVLTKIYTICHTVSSSSSSSTPYSSSSFILNNDNVLLNEECYIRKNNDWVLNDVVDKDKFIGYVSYEKYKKDIDVLKQEIQQLKAVKNKKIAPKYRSKKNYEKNKVRIKKVMDDITRMRLLSDNNELEQQINKEVKWIEDPSERKKMLKYLYEHSINKGFSRSKVYSYYKRLAIWMFMYNRKFTIESENNYSQFYLDLKEAISKEFSVVTKLVTKIEIFAKLFKLLPSGSWAVCNIPVTYYNLIYKDFWEDIFVCTKKKQKFPFEKYFNEEVLVSLFGKLSLENGDESDESQDDNSGEETN
jgi:hypothetical protein